MDLAELINVIITAAVQGATQLLPISSLGQAAIVEHVWGAIEAHQKREFLPFFIMIQIGTVCALLSYFRLEWSILFIGLFRRGVSKEFRLESWRWLLLVFVGCAPVAMIGIAFKDFLRPIYESAEIAAFALLVNGCILLLGDRVSDRATRFGHSMTIRDAFVIGVCQIPALIPGISRNGVAIVGGLLRGIRHGDAAGFSLLLSVPLTLGAAALEVPVLLEETVSWTSLYYGAVGALVAGIVNFTVANLLMGWFRGTGRYKLIPFALYSMLLGGSFLAWKYL